MNIRYNLIIYVFILLFIIYIYYILLLLADDDVCVCTPVNDYNKNIRRFNRRINIFYNEK